MGKAVEYKVTRLVLGEDPLTNLFIVLEELLVRLWVSGQWLLMLNCLARCLFIR